MVTTRSASKRGPPTATHRYESIGPPSKRNESAVQKPANNFQHPLISCETQGSESTERRSLKISLKIPSSALSSIILPKASQRVEMDAGPRKLERIARPEASGQGQVWQAAAAESLATMSAQGTRKDALQKSGIGSRKPLSSGYQNLGRKANTNTTMASGAKFNAANVDTVEISTASGGIIFYRPGSGKHNIVSGGSGTTRNLNRSLEAEERDSEVFWKALFGPWPDEESREEAEVSTKQPSKHQVALAKKVEFRAKYVTADPSWVCCCTPHESSAIEKYGGSFSSNCVFYLNLLQMQGICTVGEYRKWEVEQDTSDLAGSCACRTPAVSPFRSDSIITQAGFDYVKKWRSQLSLGLAAKNKNINNSQKVCEMLPDIMHNILRDFMMELSADQYRKRPLPLWARIEAMAWIINLLPREWHECADQPQQSDQYSCVIMFGSALLTTIDALISYQLFKTESTVRNLGLILALFIHSTRNIRDQHGSFSDSKAKQNENGWATVVIQLCEEHNVDIQGVDGIEDVIRDRLSKNTALNAKRDEARIAQYTMGVIKNHEMELIPPSEETLRRVKWDEGQPPYHRAAWKPEDDYDSDGFKYWKRWHFNKEYQSFYCRSDHGRRTVRVPSGVALNAYDRG